MTSVFVGFGEKVENDYLTFHCKKLKNVDCINEIY